MKKEESKQEEKPLEKTKKKEVKQHGRSKSEDNYNNLSISSEENEDDKIWDDYDFDYRE